MAARSHARLRRHARSVCLVALDVILIGHGLLSLEGHVGHVVAWWHVRVLGHAGAASRRGDVGSRILGRVAAFWAVDAVFAASCGFGGVEAGLGKHVSGVFWMN